MDLFGGGGSIESTLDQPVVPGSINIKTVLLFGGVLWALGSLLKHGGWRKNPRKRGHRRSRRR